MISRDVRLSRLPVGSSASSSFGPFASARAIATRCCSPPESSFGRCCCRPPRPTDVKSAVARASRSARGTPANIIESATLSAAVIVDTRLND